MPNILVILGINGPFGQTRPLPTLPPPNRRRDVRPIPLEIKQRVLQHPVEPISRRAFLTPRRPQLGNRFSAHRVASRKQFPFLLAMTFKRFLEQFEFLRIELPEVFPLRRVPTQVRRVVELVSPFQAASRFRTVSKMCQQSQACQPQHAELVIVELFDECLEAFGVNQEQDLWKRVHDLFIIRASFAYYKKTRRYYWSWNSLAQHRSLCFIVRGNISFQLDV